MKATGDPVCFYIGESKECVSRYWCIHRDFLRSQYSEFLTFEICDNVLSFTRVSMGLLQGAAL